MGGSRVYLSGTRGIGVQEAERAYDGMGRSRR